MEEKLIAELGGRSKKALNPRYLIERNVSTVWFCLRRYADGVGIVGWFTDVIAIIVRYYLQLVKVSISATCKFASVANYLGIVSYGAGRGPRPPEDGGMENPCYMGKFMTLVSGQYFTIAYDEFGWIGWGNNQWGQLGDGTDVSTHGGYVRGKYKWQKNGKIGKIVCGNSCCLMLTVDGIAFRWGARTAKPIRVIIGCGNSPIIDIYANEYCSVCLMRDHVAIMGARYRNHWQPYSFMSIPGYKAVRIISVGYFGGATDRLQLDSRGEFLIEFAGPGDEHIIVVRPNVKSVQRGEYSVVTVGERIIDATQSCGRDYGRDRWCSYDGDNDVVSITQIYWLSRIDPDAIIVSPRDAACWSLVAVVGDKLMRCSNEIQSWQLLGTV